VYDYVDKDSLPSTLGGSVNLTQSDWISYLQVRLSRPASTDSECENVQIDLRGISSQSYEAATT